MSKTIWKFPLSLVDQQVIELRQGAHVLSVGLDSQSDLCLWAHLDPHEGPLTAKVRIVGTGRPAEGLERYRFLGSVLQGSFVWHVFVEGV
jgi:hypothetical protein